MVDAIGQKNVHPTESIVVAKHCKTVASIDERKSICFSSCRFFAEKLAENDILSNLRSEFCISKGAGLFEHQRYCDLYLQCNEQGVGVTMECSRKNFN